MLSWRQNIQTLFTVLFVYYKKLKPWQKYSEVSNPVQFKIGRMILSKKKKKKKIKQEQTGGGWRRKVPQNLLFNRKDYFVNFYFLFLNACPGLSCKNLDTIKGGQCKSGIQKNHDLQIITFFFFASSISLFPANIYFQNEISWFRRENLIPGRIYLQFDYTSSAFECLWRLHNVSNMTLWKRTQAHSTTTNRHGTWLLIRANLLKATEEPHLDG